MLLRSLIFIASILTTFISSAALVTYKYTTLDEGDGINITGSFGYETTWPDEDPSDDFYTGAAFLNGTITGGINDGTTFNHAGGDIIIWEGTNSYNQYDVISLIFNEHSEWVATVDLVDEDGTWFTGNTLPSSLPASGFLVSELNYLLNNQSYYRWLDINGFSVVPAPPAFWLFVSALLGFITWSRKRYN